MICAYLHGNTKMFVLFLAIQTLKTLPEILQFCLKFIHFHSCTFIHYFSSCSSKSLAFSYKSEALLLVLAIAINIPSIPLR